mmetsp:Transcript_43926/g.65151  ORF Transcript_43926/g.65151 Transcript_43926/m.65151 type:complete len:99 (-) Transcript_43926:112-408(-)
MERNMRSTTAAAATTTAYRRRTIMAASLAYDKDSAKPGSKQKKCNHSSQEVLALSRYDDNQIQVNRAGALLLAGLTAAEAIHSFIGEPSDWSYTSTSW